MTAKLDPILPGEILLEDFMEPRGLTTNKLARALRVPANRLTDIIRGGRALTSDTALRLGAYFGTSPSLWLNLQTEYDLRKTR
jgi:addiction module HigA family antidote